MSRLEKAIKKGEYCIKQEEPVFCYDYDKYFLCLASEIICESINEIEFSQKAFKKEKKLKCAYLGDFWIKISEEEIYYCVCNYYKKK